MKTKHFKCWERITMIMKYCKQTVIADFAKSINLPRGENLYQIKNGNNKISLKLAENIKNQFPEISILWILLGEGEMFISPSVTETSSPLVELPLFSHPSMFSSQDIGADHLVLAERRYTFSLNFAGTAQFLCMYRENDLYPLISPGAMLFMRQADIETGQISYGDVHYVQMEGGTGLYRKIMETDNEDYIRLSTSKLHTHDDIIVRISDITHLYIVCKWCCGTELL